MKKMLRNVALSGLVVAWFLLPASGHAACAVGIGNLNGWYGLLVSGSTVGSGSSPKYLAGALLFDGAGGIKGNHVYSGAGVDNTATGGYVLNSDCTLTLTLTVGAGAAQVYSVALKQGGEAVGIETDASAVATVDLQAQYSTVVTGLNFTSSSLNGTYAGSCIGPIGLYSDLNVVTFNNGSLNGTDPYNNNGSYAVANDPYSGTYTINSDGTFSGSLVVDSTPFDFYGVIANSGAKVEYIYSTVNNGVPGPAFSSCVDKLAAAIVFPTQGN